MSICSWDVGITHLAYCIMEYKPDDEKIKFPIYHWNNLNLINTTPIKCNYPIKKKKKTDQQVLCDKNALYYIYGTETGYCGSHKKKYMEINKNTNTFYKNTYKDKKCNVVECEKQVKYYKINENNENIFYCNSHKKEFDSKNNEDYILLKDSKYDNKYNCSINNCDKTSTYYSDDKYYCTKHSKKINNLQKIVPKTCEDKINDIQCTKKAQYYKCNSSNNIISYYCTDHKNINMSTENEKNVLQDIKKSKVGKVSIDSVLFQLMTQLDKIPELLQVDKVIIENQPSLKNPKMKTIASALYSYFLIRGIMDKERTSSKITKISFISPSNKLKVDNDNSIKVLSSAENAEKKYKLTKALGIKYCKQLISNDESSKKLLEIAKQKGKIDDLCDAMIQGAYYLSIRKQ
jgi:hypothetical protein